MKVKKRTVLGCIGWLGLSLVCAVTEAAQRPNIVLMLADDQAWSGTSVAMHPEIRASRSAVYSTPNLERLASQGKRFSQAYAPAPVCSPTRISLQTGKSPAQLHWTKAAPPVEGMKLTEPKLIKDISEGDVTIAELLRDSGYATAHYGKWHIGGGGPGHHGYDEHDGDTGNEHAFQFKGANPVDIFGMADRAEKFMVKSKEAGKPFFIQLSWNALHAPENASADSIAKYRELMKGASEKEITTAAITEDLDRGVGRVLESLDRLGLSASTYVIYMSDNGASGGKGGGKSGLRGGKGGVWEGGLRVPFIVRGPGIAADSWSHVPVVGYDLFPTFCHWAMVDQSSIPAAIEGGSLHTLLIADSKTMGTDLTVQRRFPWLGFHFPHYQSDTPQSSILVGSLKLVHDYESDTDMLFDLADDLSEREDLAAKLPEKAAVLRKDLERYLDEIDARRPTANPRFDQSESMETGKKREGRGQNKALKKVGKR